MKHLRVLNSNANPLKSVAGNRAASVVLAALLAVAVTLSGCSKAKSKDSALNSSNQNSNSGAVASSAPVAASTPPVVSQATETKKKPVKRRPSVVTYSDKTYGLSFQYPRSYTLKAGEQAKLDSTDLELLPMNFVQPGGVSVAVVELPSKSFLGTDLYSASFNVRTNNSLTAEQCEQFGTPASVERPSVDGNHTPASGDFPVVAEGSHSESDSSTAQEKATVSPTKVSIHGVEFSKLENTSEQTETKYYHRFENGVCYEFALGVATAESKSGDLANPVDHQEAFVKLEKILTTVKIKSDAAPAITASDKGNPVNDGSH